MFKMSGFFAFCLDLALKKNLLKKKKTVTSIDRLSMTFVFPANNKNSTSAICRLYAEMSRFVLFVNVSFPPIFLRILF